MKKQSFASGRAGEECGHGGTALVGGDRVRVTEDRTRLSLPSEVPGADHRCRTS